MHFSVFEIGRRNPANSFKQGLKSGGLDFPGSAALRLLGKKIYQSIGESPGREKKI